MRDVLLFLAKFLVVSAVLFVVFARAEEPYYKMLAHVTAATGAVTGASIEVLDVRGNVMKLGYGGMEISAPLTFAAFNPVVLFSLLVATPGIGRRTLAVGLGGFALLLAGQVLTLRLFLAMQLRGYGASPGLEFLEILVLLSICVNWVLPVIIWVIWVPTGFLTRALKAGMARS